MDGGSSSGAEGAWDVEPNAARLLQAGRPMLMFGYTCVRARVCVRVRVIHMIVPARAFYCSDNGGVSVHGLAGNNYPLRVSQLA